MVMSSTTQTILLRPRVHDEYAGRLLLVPILEHKPARVLPPELWAAIFSSLESPQFQWSLLSVCKLFNALAKSHAYSFVTLTSLQAFGKLYSVVEKGEKTWSGVARTRYSIPGRWIHHLDVSSIHFEGRASMLAFDSLLGNLFPMLPNLQSFQMNPAFSLSLVAATSLAQKAEITTLRSIKGFSVSCSAAESGERERPLLTLLKVCQGLEELELLGHGFDPTDIDVLFPEWTEDPVSLNLPNLHSLTLLSMPRSLAMASLLQSALPSLKKLTLTPFADIPYPASLSSRFIETRGPGLQSLTLFTRKVWPVRCHPSPTSLLLSCPRLRHLSLETPLPVLQIPSKHTSLRILSIPRPKMEAWPSYNQLLPHLPELVAIHIRDVKWLRRGMNQIAQIAGVQGEMLEWRRRLGKRGIRLLDSEWKDPEL